MSDITTATEGVPCQTAFSLPKPGDADYDARDGDFEVCPGVRVVATPGHTPDSLCLLDAENGLLLTGDTFYAGELYLWAPETDVKAYAASIDRLAALAPGLKRLLTAHGPPVADPGLLLELRAALEGIVAGSVRFETTGQGRRRYEFRHFSILTTGVRDPGRSGPPRESGLPRS